VLAERPEFVGEPSAARHVAPVSPGSTREEGRQPARVLVVSEERSLRANLRSLLAADGRFTSLEVEDAGSAMVAALGGGFDLCVVGLVDPAQRLAVIAAIAANAPRTKVLAHAPALGDSELLAALRAGAVGYLPAGCEPGELAGALAALLAGGAFLSAESLARVLEALRSESRRATRRAARHERLTGREWDVLELLAENLSTAEIARQLAIKEVTVRSHVAATLRKLDVPSRHAAIRVYRREPRAFESS
jgi:DNA-binding NarL/FixJ family response regulator